MIEQALEKLSVYVHQRGLHYSTVREVILKEIYDSHNALSVDEIFEKINEKIQKKVSYNTVYRVLRLLETCELVLTIQSSCKKTYYFKIEEGCSVFLEDKMGVLRTLDTSSVADTLVRKYQHDKKRCFVVIHEM